MNEIVQTRKLPTLIPCGEFKKIEFPEDQYLIQGLLPREGFAIIASPSGEKKTWIGLSMADAIARGTDFVGHPEFKTQKGRVLYLDQEMPRALLQGRMKLLDLSDDIIVPEKLDSLDFQKSEDLNWLHMQIQSNAFKVVFIDTLRATAGGLKEDKAEDVRAYMDRFLKFKNMGVCIVFLDHCRKPHPFEGKTPKKEQLLGSQDKVACIESLLMLKSDVGSPEIKIYPQKNRSGIEYKPFSVVMESVLGDQVNENKINLKYGEPLEGSQENKSEEAKALILDFLADGSKTTRQTVEYLRTEKIGESNVRLALRELERSSKIRAEKQGRENLYSLECADRDSSLDI